MMAKSSPTHEHLRTITNSDTPCLTMTADGTVETNEVATTHIKDLDILLRQPVGRIFSNTALGMLCETMSYLLLMEDGNATIFNPEHKTLHQQAILIAK